MGDRLQLAAHAADLAKDIPARSMRQCVIKGCLSFVGKINLTFRDHEVAREYHDETLPRKVQS